MKLLQNYLKEFYPGLTDRVVADGDFGPITQKSVNAVLATYSDRQGAFTEEDWSKIDDLLQKKNRSTPTGRTDKCIAQRIGDVAKASKRSCALPLPKEDMGIFATLNYLSVEESARYLPNPKTGSTYCNIYGTDFADCLGVYLPHVWWLDDKGSAFKELNANAMYNWLHNQSVSGNFGWQRALDAKALQDKVNQGHFGVICAKRQGVGSGHITVVLPESFRPKETATEFFPVQSQAGTFNMRTFAAKKGNWWGGKAYASVVFMYGPKVIQ